METKKLAATVGLGFASVAVAGLAAALLARRHFLGRIEDIKRWLESSRAASGRRPGLPPAVIALASRLGVPASSRGRIVRMTQRGEMCFRPGAKPMPFTAEQVITVGQIGFLWHAHFCGAGGFMQVADYLADGEAGLEAALLAAIPLARLRGSDAMFRGEAMRYLAELIWNPDALLFNDQLAWRVIDERTLAVGAGEGTPRCEVRLTLDEAGDMIGMAADDRPRLEGGKVTSCHWFGRAGTYQSIGGRRIPICAEVGWILNGVEFVYWRGRVESWRVEA